MTKQMFKPKAISTTDERSTVTGSSLGDFTHTLIGHLFRATVSSISIVRYLKHFFSKLQRKAKFSCLKLKRFMVLNDRHFPMLT